LFESRGEGGGARGEKSRKSASVRRFL